MLALKEATTSPFLALDEPDVFMDEHSRRLTIECLIQVAFLALTSTQHSFLFPSHSSCFATAAPFVSVENDAFGNEGVQVLKMHKDSQSIIISPHSMITIPNDDPQIQKIVMRPVDRNQQRLPFQPVGADAERDSD